MWIVAKDFRGQGIGGALLSHSESRLGMTVAVGSNESTSVPIYLKAGYKRIKGLHHWYTVLHRDGLQLLRGSVPHSFPYPQRPGSYIDDISEISDPKLMATIWKRFAEANRLTGLHRSPEFWTWRYLRHPKFRYFLHSNRSKTALSVSRIENVVLEGKTIRVLRIIEFIPSQDSKRSATSSDKNIAFLKELLGWATTLGCVAADFRSSQFELYFFLREAGFLVNRFETGLGNAGFAGQLNPLDYSARPINVHWKVNASIETGVQNLYITKADNDMDRPNRRGVRSRRLDD